MRYGEAQEKKLCDVRQLAMYVMYVINGIIVSKAERLPERI